MDISPGIFENTQVAFAGKSDADLQKAKALFTIVGNNSFVKLGTALANFSLKLHLPVSPLFKWTVYNHFCGGETFEECTETIRGLTGQHVGVLLNYGIEFKESEEDFDNAVAINIEAIKFAGKNKAVKAVCVKPTGYGRLELFEKVQRGEHLKGNEKKEYERVCERFEELCEEAAKYGATIYIDAEESWIQDALDKIAEDLMARFNKQRCVVANTFQMYRHDRLAYLQQQIADSQKGGYVLGAKLVRGAYMEKERERAEKMGYPSPISKNKKAVDADFDAAVKLCLESLSHTHVCVASQSEKSNLLAIQLMDSMKINRGTESVVFSQLYGMGDNVTFNLARLGFNATKYLPYGPVKDVVPYLIRRAQENTSVAGQTGRELSLIQKEIKRRKNQK